MTSSDLRPQPEVRYSLRLKVLLALALAGLCLLMTVGAVLPSLVIKRFDDQEQRRMREDTLRVRKALDTELRGLGAFVPNWSAWDDTYDYIRAPTREYETSNLVPASFESARLNLFIFLNTAGQVVHASAFDLAAQRPYPGTDLSREILRRTGSDLILRGEQDSREGIVMLSSGPWLLAARPILTGEGKGPVAGTVVLGRQLTPAVLRELKRDTNLSLRIEARATPGGGQALVGGDGILVTALSDTRLEGRTIVQDLARQPSIHVVVGAARQDHATGLLTARTILLVGLVVALLFTGLTIGMVERLVLRRLGQYREQVEVIMNHGPVTARFAVSGRDELSDLGHALNSLLDQSEASRRQLKYHATHDELTGLPNRTQLRRDLSARIAQGQPFAVVLLDLDNFKAINDTLGHEIGDEVLRAAGARMTGHLPPGGLLTRLGGDEFALLLPDDGDGQLAGALVQTLLDGLNQPLVTSVAELRIQASAGISCWPADDANESALLRYADLAMYRAKGLAGGVARYQPQLTEEALRRNEIEQLLPGVLERGELWLAYQPVVELASGRIVGCEALLRWRSPQHGNVSPALFIPIAEERGLIHEIGAWVMREACTRAAAWHRAGLNLSVAVNVSAVQLRDGGFAQQVAATLHSSGLSPALLELEVTETAVMADLAGATRQLAQLRSLGVSVALDDFGTGYASLELVRELPLDKLKLDGSFVTGAEQDARRQVIVGAVIRMARDLHLRVVAEGVETPQQRDLLLGLECRLAQGYLYARPLPCEELLRLVQEGGAPAWPAHPAPARRPA